MPKLTLDQLEAILKEPVEEGIKGFTVFEVPGIWPGNMTDPDERSPMIDDIDLDIDDGLEEQATAALNIVWEGMDVSLIDRSNPAVLNKAEDIAVSLMALGSLKALESLLADVRALKALL